MTETPVRRTGHFIRNCLLNLSAAGGAVCILAVAAAVLFDITLIMFKTGSMAPAIPAGAVAVVRQIPAADVAVGDIVTVERGASLPVTHRVRNIEPGAGAARTLTLKGDANINTDPQTYSVDTVRIVLFAVPGLAPLIVSASHPAALGGIALAVAALVTWVLWPRPSPAPPRQTQ